jgi:hypothetical protein
VIGTIGPDLRGAPVVTGDERGPDARYRRARCGAAPLQSAAMSMTEAEALPPRAHARVVYQGPVAPHWEVESEFGDRGLVEEFRARVLARLLLIPPHDPQFRRNRERVNRDAERERILLEWDLGTDADD